MVLFSGRVLSVTWSTDAKFIYSGSSDGYVLMLHDYHPFSLLKLTGVSRLCPYAWLFQKKKKVDPLA